MPAWTTLNAKHLLSRALFGYSRKDLETALSYKTVEEFIDKQLLTDSPQPAPPDVWVNELPIANNGTIDGDRFRAMTYWWYNRMLNEKTNMREKLVLFWHNHFVSGRDVVPYPQQMYFQNELFRKNAFGNFKQFTKDVSIDPAMLIYLDNRLNTKNAPNENYAREIMELFTIGIGNYTEQDIKQAALAMTGWELKNAVTAQFNSAKFSTVSKTFMGRTGNFNMNDIIDIIFDRTETAEFVARKFYKEFIYHKPNETFVKQMAKVLRDAKYEIKPMLRFMFASDEFYNDSYKGSHIKNPIEMVVGIYKALDVSKLETQDMAYIYDQTRNMQQQIFQPPNVAGWPGQRNWISSTTYVLRGAFSDSVINGKQINGVVMKNQFNKVTLDYIRTFKSAEAATKLIADVITLFLQFPVSTKKEKFLLETMLDGTTTTNWSTSTPGADVRVQKLLKAVMRLPEFQMS
jgi:uncharacterized protein (DUF1800 family)